MYLCHAYGHDACSAFIKIENSIMYIIETFNNRIWQIMTNIPIIHIS